MPASARALAGKRAEDAVAGYLVARGFSVLARNLRLGRDEIDIVARDGALVAIVEVRTRGAGSFERPFESVSGKKKRFLIRATERLWRERLRQMESVERVRIDVAAVTFDGDNVEIEYVAGAIVA